MKLISLLLLLCVPVALRAQNIPAFYDDVSGATHSTFAASFPSLGIAATPVVCGFQYGGTAAAFSMTDDTGQVLTFQPAASVWDKTHRQGLALFTGAAGGSTFTVKASAAVNYISLGCVPIKSAVDASKAPVLSAIGSALSSSLTLATGPGDIVVAFIAEDQSGNGDVFTPAAGYTLVEDAGKTDGFAIAVSNGTTAGNPSFTLAPAGRSTIISAVAFKAPPTAPQPTVLPIAGLGTASTLISSAGQVPTCTAADGVCSIVVQVCDRNRNCFVLPVDGGTLELVKTVTLPQPQTLTVTVATLAASQ
jgi:hypothetical protein